MGNILTILSCYFKNRLHNYDGLREVTQIYFTALIQQALIQLTSEFHKDWFIHMNTEDQSPKFSLFHRGSLQSKDFIQNQKQASFTVTIIKANTSSSQWIREVKLQLRSPPSHGVCCICCKEDAQSILCHWKGIVWKKWFLRNRIKKIILPMLR